MCRERDELQREMDAIRRSFVEKEIKEKVMEEERRIMQEEVSRKYKNLNFCKWPACFNLLYAFSLSLPSLSLSYP